jgi:hypothetical protein
MQRMDEIKISTLANFFLYLRISLKSISIQKRHFFFYYITNFHFPFFIFILCGSVLQFLFIVIFCSNLCIIIIIIISYLLGYICERWMVEGKQIYLTRLLPIPINFIGTGNSVRKRHLISIILEY